VALGGRGVPFTAKEFQSKGGAVTDLTENLAAEQKARTVCFNPEFDKQF